jgi:ubiquinone/menaquinone biosynthesis C-methylase UbiE
LAIPHYDEFQDTVRLAIQDHITGLQPTDKITVIEVGCGTGHTTRKILEADNRIQVTTLDNEEKMLAQARKALIDFEGRIDFIQEDILSFIRMLGKESIDVFASANTLHNFQPDIRLEIFEQAARILKKGGLFVNSDKYALDNKEEHRRVFEDFIKALNVLAEYGRRDLKDMWVEHCMEDEKIKITEGKEKDALTKLGFKDVRTTHRKSLEATIVATKNKVCKYHQF